MTRVLRFTSFVYIYVVVVNKNGDFLWITCFFLLLTISCGTHKHGANVCAPDSELRTTLACFGAQTSCPVYAHSECTAHQPAICQLIHRLRWKRFLTVSHEFALPQCPQEKARRIDRFGEFALNRPRFAFQLGRDEFGR